MNCIKMIVGGALCALAGTVGAVAAGDLDIGVTFLTPRTVRITKTRAGGTLHKPFETVTAKPGNVTVRADGDVWATDALVVRLDRAAGTLAFTRPDGTPILAEKGPATLTDDVKNGVAYVRPDQSFAPAADEGLYGLGDLENGRLNQRGEKRTLRPDNVGDGIPYVASDRGWAIWWDNTSPTLFADVPGEAMRFESDAGDFVDYYFIWGGSGDGCIAEMRALTGDVPLFPRWAFGFWQSKERYKTPEETVEVVETYRRRGIPLDGIVQDWQYWGGNYLWNAMEFTGEAWGGGERMIRRVHELNAKIIITVWQSFGPGTKAYRELEPKGLLFPFETWPRSGLGHIWPPRMDYPSGVKLCDNFSPVVRDVYWANMKRLWHAGIDGWWMDSTDPDHIYKEGDFEHPTAAGATFRAVRNAYPLSATGGVYAHQRAETDRRRVFILTRGASAGQQRFATSVWSGDIGSSWDTLRAQIPGGLNYTLTGNPHFNCDIGGFFAGRYGRGAAGVRNLAYRELYARWMQLGTFLPMMRSHGTDVPREIYLYGEPGEPVYDALAGAVRLRYRLMPYLYSLAGHVTKDRASIMRPVWFDYPAAAQAKDGTDRFLLGRDILATPILRALYTGESNRPVGAYEGWEKTTDGAAAAAGGGQPIDFDAPRPFAVALPAGSDWWQVTDALAVPGGETRCAGGATAALTVTLRSQPFFVRAGAILPVGPDVQFNGEKAWDDLEVVVFPGADGAFDFYEDAFETYAYEKGEWSEIPFRWDDAAGTLTIGARVGGYPEMIRSRTFRVRRAGTAAVTAVTYTGAAVTVTL